MAIRQLSVFLENKKGTLHEISSVLANGEVNLRSMCIADTADYGIVRIIADNPDKAKDVLTKAGHTASVREVTAFAVPDCPGGLSKVLSILEENSIDIEYLYALVTKTVGKAYAVARTSDDIKAEAVLKQNGIELLDEAHI